MIHPIAVIEKIEPDLGTAPVGTFHEVDDQD
jgi:hypothetical protein